MHSSATGGQTLHSIPLRALRGLSLAFRLQIFHNQCGRQWPLWSFAFTELLLHVCPWPPEWLKLGSSYNHDLQLTSTLILTKLLIGAMFSVLLLRYWDAVWWWMMWDIVILKWLPITDAHNSINRCKKVVEEENFYSSQGKKRTCRANQKLPSDNQLVTASIGKDYG